MQSATGSRYTIGLNHMLERDLRYLSKLQKMESKKNLNKCMKIKIKAFFFFFAQITLISVSVCQIVSSVVPDLILKHSN